MAFSPHKPREDRASRDAQPPWRAEGALPGAVPRARVGVLGGVAIAALVLAAMTAACKYEQDYDAHWHLAAGQWMLRHHRVLDHDPYTCEPDEPGAPWVNVYWLFQLTMAAAHWIGGFAGMTVVQVLVTGAAFLAFALSLHGRVPTAWLALAGLLVLPVYVSRVRMRPETFTLCFLMATTLLAEGVRRGGPAGRLWWLVPMMAVWVNMHGLYFLGPMVMWAAMAGAALDKRVGRGALAGNLPTRAALAPAIAATAACLASPWPFEAALHPLILWKRISGRNEHYTYGVGEFTPTWETIWTQHDMLAILCVLAIVLVLAVRARRLPLAHAAMLLPILALAMLAVRNVALLAPVCGPIIAWHGGVALRQWGARLSLRRPGAGRVAARAGAVAVTLVALAATAGFATECTYRLRRTGERTGLGLCPDRYMTGLATWLGEANFPGNVLAVNFGDGSAFLYHSYPARQVWMDGRLEIKSFARFQRYQQLNAAFATPIGAETAEIPESVRFLAVGRDDPQRLAALSQCGRFRLLRLDRAGALFARRDYRDARPPRVVAEELPRTPNLDDFDHPLGADGLVEGFGADRRHWYRQDVESATFHFGKMMTWLGAPSEEGGRPMSSPLQLRCSRLAVRYLDAAVAEGTVQPDVARGMLAQAIQQWAAQTAPPIPSPSEDGSPAALPGRAIDMDVNLSRALCLHAGVDLASLPERDRQTFGMERVRALVDAHDYDAAMEAMRAFIQSLPTREQMFLASDYVNLQNRLSSRLADAEADLIGLEPARMSPLDRAAALADPRRGLTLRAVRELEASLEAGARSAGGDGAVPARSLAAMRVAAGDLLLRLGRPAPARAHYLKAAGDANRQDVSLRLALCEWVEGNLPAALAMFEGAGRADGEAPRQINDPVALYFRSLLLEEMGRYEQAKKALRAAESAAPDLARLIDRAWARL
jgi:tetratricopeptide (TPR) repeat protein